MSSPPFRTMKLRSKKPTCPACGLKGQKVGQIEDIDYVAFCGGNAPDYEATGLKEGRSGHRIKPKDMQQILQKENVRIIDVRPPIEYDTPLPELVANPSSYLSDSSSQTFVVCRLGNDSQIAADALRSVASENQKIQDLIGGLRAWSRDVDPEFPVY
ncbi:hypothetical protein M422DRAFT_56831 [Sphaerobolus stellatus SS14]|uniref:Unplaced genomic scaffold SPHSTscaffold_595, whole genome shotgun sequence n=1 Tax=Sphaerobolus stellatus (strain SS14) TaxID=990650 RepID=A0A0C9U316_SPHS4|nr:hypothetical protein M422DRAFT_56831 [Sphaerobolus stellatus SS14]